MPPRLLCLLVVLVAALPTAARAQKKTPPAKQAVIVTTSTVFYRTKGKADWRLFGYYSSELSAKKVFNHLALSSFEVKLEITNTPLPKLPSRPTVVPTDTEVVSYQKAVEVFNWMAGQKDIAFRFPLDGCYARAQLMVERMLQKGYRPRKVWAVAHGEELYARTKNHPSGHVTWAYHVAPALGVRQDKTRRWYIIDPSLFDKPATVTQWVNAQLRMQKSHRPFLTLTKIGEAPLWVDRKRKNGTGYWPATDPKQGLHAHAVAVMKKYKPWEGKAPPKGVVLDFPFGARTPWGFAFAPRSRSHQGETMGWSSTGSSPGSQGWIAGVVDASGVAVRTRRWRLAASGFSTSTLPG
jgi:hypothetical protein